MFYLKVDEVFGPNTPSGGRFQRSCANCKCIVSIAQTNGGRAGDESLNYTNSIFTLPA